VIVFDEFQEILALDAGFPNLMRAVFQAQPEVATSTWAASGICFERIFSDKNEPFWRSAKQLEIGVIPPDAFEPFLRQRSRSPASDSAPTLRRACSDSTGGHPYATQELAYFVWELVAEQRRGIVADVEEVSAASYARSTTTLSSVGRRTAAAASPDARARRRAVRAVYSADYASRHDLPRTPTLQRALTGLVQKEIVAQDRDGEYRIVELPSWPSGCGARRLLLDELEQLEHRQVHRDDDHADHRAHGDHHQGLDDRGQRADRGVDLVLVEVRDLPSIFSSSPVSSPILTIWLTIGGKTGFSISGCAIGTPCAPSAERPRALPRSPSCRRSGR
jgi:hypothetical protein